MQGTVYVGLDVHKASVSVSVAEDGRNGAVRFLGPIPNTPVDIAKLAKRLQKDASRLEFCYEAGCCGYVIYRQLVELGHGCMVVAPSLIPRKPGERIKTDRRDCQKLAVMHRSGDLTAVWVPDAVHEAMRDLVRARMDATMQSKRARQQLLGFLLRHGLVYPSNRNTWTKAHFRWLAEQKFDQPAHRLVFQDYVEAVLTATERTEQMIGSIRSMLPEWSMRPVVEALRGLRGIDLISAVTLVASLGDLSRFETPRQLMAYVGLVPAEHSSGDRVRRSGITKAGNNEARRVLVEASWCYRYPARVARAKSEIIVELPKPVRDIAWKAQVRLCGRFQRLSLKGKKSTVVVTAVARELCGFIWAIGQQVRPVMS